MINKFIIPCVFFFSFIPYVSPLPISSDTQPIFVIFIMILFVISPNFRKIKKTEIPFLILALLAIFYINPEYPSFTIKKSSSLLIAFLSYHFFSLHRNKLTQKFLFFIVLLNFIVLIINFVSPSVYSQLFGPFLQAVRSHSDMKGPRGASGLAPEPGFIGALSVFYIMATIIISKKENNKKYKYLIIILSVIMITLTKSGTGLLLLVLFTLLYNIKLNLLRLLYGLILTLLIFNISKNLNLGRASYLLENVIIQPEVILKGDASVGSRYIGILVGTTSFLESPFGNGNNSYERVAVDIIKKNNIFRGIEGGIGKSSSYGRLMVELGLFFVIFLFCLIYFSMNKSKWRYSTSFIVIATTFIMASFSITFPPIWYLFSHFHNPSKEWSVHK